MKIEKLKKDYRKRILIVAGIALVIVATVFFVVTRAKYQYTAIFPAVKGTINYKSGDVSVLAINLQQDDGTYLDSEDFPTSGYTLNTTESYCVRSTESGQITQEVEMSYENNTFTITGLRKKGTKCFLYFDIKPMTISEMIATYTKDTSRESGSFTGVFTEDTNGKIFEGPADDSGTVPTYFFAGANPNNWVKFGKEGTSDIWWRIIRVNSDGTIRMIYNGTSTATTGTGTQISNDGGTTTSYAFNSNSFANAYVGYMYGSAGSKNYTDTHKNTKSSYAKEQVDTWYNTNLNKTGTKEHIDTNAGFCGDRSLNMTSETWWSSDTKKGYGYSDTAYGPYGRLRYNDGSSDIWRTTQSATLKCTNEANDLYTVGTSGGYTASTRGNKALTYPVGLITADEVVFAGGFGGVDNTSYWLFTNRPYWTMSPYYYNGLPVVFVVDSSGDPFGLVVSRDWDVRPVINLRADTQLTGSGTTTDPYVVV